jgi:hypothetical protein
MKLRYSNSLWSDTENWMHTASTLWYKRLATDGCSCNGRVQHSCTKENFLCSLSLTIPILSLFYPCGQQSQITKGCNKNVNFTSRKIHFYGSQMFYDTRDCGRMSSVTSSSDLIMQNHFVKKRNTFLYSTNRIIKTKTKKSITFLFKYFQTLHYNMWHYVLCW